MASKKQQSESKDPLSFFTASDESSDDSDSESDPVNEEKPVEREEGVETSDKTTEKLPSPETLFATVGKPAFLETKLEKEMDWNVLSKRYEPLFENQEGGYPAAKAAFDERDDTGAVISSAPVKYKTELNEVQKHIVVHLKRSADIVNIISGSSDNNSESSGGGGSTKKQKT